jgi:hypothetical protein
MAWNFATFVQSVAAAGKAEYPLPMYANAALVRPNYEPGQYNSGGPLPHSIDLWHAGAPALDFESPDIYFNEFAYWAGKYARPDNPLFIPEAQGGSTGAANALYAYGHLSAICFSPFGVDDEGNAPLDLVGITNPAVRPDNNAIGHLYAVLSALAPTLLQKQANGGLAAAVLEGDAQRSGRLAIGGYTATLSRAGNPSDAASRVGVMFIQTGPSEFLVVGSGEAQVTFSIDIPGPPIVGIESIDEERLKNGTFVLGRRLNGDENSQGQALKLHASDLSEGTIYRVRLYRYN